jgi:hypothetical protein
MPGFRHPQVVQSKWSNPSRRRRFDHSSSVVDHNTKITTMNDNTIGSLVSIYGIASPDLGCSCDHHAVCGSLVHIDMLVRFKKVAVDDRK